MVVVDSFFQQGFKHEVCEDYALHGDLTIPYAIVCDGCSNGNGPSINSDFGSRILAKAAEEHILRPTEALLNGVADTAKTQIRSFILDNNALCSTLMIVRKYDNDSKQVITVGDGFVCARKKTGEWVIKDIDFLPGGTDNHPAPFYLKYKMFGEIQNYKNQFGGMCRISTFTGDLLNPELDLPSEIPKPNVREMLFMEKLHYEEEKFEVSDDLYHCEFSFPDEEYDLVCVFTDGPNAVSKLVKTPRQKFIQHLHSLDVIRKLVSFVRFKNGFLNHHRNWLFKQNKTGTILKEEWITGDDISAGVIYTGE